jgi:predicted nucleic acid-binding protein
MLAPSAAYAAVGELGLTGLKAGTPAAITRHDGHTPRPKPEPPPGRACRCVQASWWTPNPSSICGKVTRSFCRSSSALFKAEAAGDLRIALSALTLAQVLTGPLRAGQDALAQRYEKALANYTVAPLGTAVAALAARTRARYGLKLPDAIQLATALNLEAAARVTHNRYFERMQGLLIIWG